MRTLIHGPAALLLFPSALALAALARPAASVASPRGETLEFETAELRFELNETDQDAEVVLRLKGPEGLCELELRAPGGEVVFELEVEDGALLDVGLQQFLIESGEPDIRSVLEAFPEGAYEVHGTTVAGEAVAGELLLSHLLAPAPIYRPGDGAVLPPSGVLVTWIPVAGAARYQIEVEQDELGVNLTATVPAGVTTFLVPDGFLMPGTEYELGISTIAENGNVSVAESAFTTIR